MAFGTKTNERPGTRASVRYLRVSAYKAREVLDLIRGLHVDDADGVLEFTDRAVATDIRHSGAVVNVDRDGLVVDEFGRAGKERKLHITVMPSARVVDSQRNPHTSRTQDAFVEKTIALSDIKPGDFVVVDMSHEGQKLVGGSVMVTLRGSGK